MNDYIWLTEPSRLFLERGYLTEGQTVEERVDVICDAAEKILNKPGFAEAFKANFKKGWYSFSTPVWTNFGTDRGLPISCVVGDTWINTKEKGGKQARDICIGDEVLTHKGRYKKVTNVIVTPDKSDIYCLKVSTRMTNLYLTGNHPVLTNLGWVKTENLDPSLHLVAINREIEIEEKPHIIDMREFVDYEYIEKDGLLCKTGSDNVRKDRQVETVSYYSKPNADIILDEDLAWAFGLWFAEGSLTTSNKKKPNGIRITTNNDDEKDIANKWLKIISNKFNINGNAYESAVVRSNQYNSWYTVNANSGVVGNLFASFGKGCKEKTIPNWIMNSPKNILQMFLDGVLAGDGSYRKNGSCKITLANPKLILQIYQIGLKLGLSMSLQMQEKAGKLATTNHVYTILFRPNKLGTGKFTGNCVVPFENGLSYAPIRKLEKTERKEMVYDFTVEEDHSFSAAGVILHNCFGSFIDDSMESIAHTWAEVCMMTKYGGGTSAYFGNLRPRGAKIKNNGVSSGSVHFMQLFENLINVVSQGNTRRGQFAAYLPVDHEDIEEFLTLRSEGSPIQDLSFGVCVPDAWMQSMINGDSQKRKVWARVLECRSSMGYPYIFFTDTANRDTVDVYKDKGMKITHSNLCVAGNQRVVSDRGLKTAKELYEEGGELILFDNEKPVKASEMKLIEKDADVYKIHLSNGMTHTVTEYHKVKTRSNKRHWSGHYTWNNISCSELKVGDKVAIQTNKGIFGATDMTDEAYLLGLYQGDGTQSDLDHMIDIWEKDFDLIDDIQECFKRVCEKHNTQVVASGRTYNIPKFHDCVINQGNVAKKRLSNRALKKLGFEKGKIPDWLWNCNEDTMWMYMKGLFFTDGTVHISDSKGNPIQLSLASINKPFLQEIQLILSNLGMQTSIRLLREEGQTLLPDGKGGKKLYDTKTCWRLIIGNKNDAQVFNSKTGFLDRKNIHIESRKFRDNTKKCYSVLNIEHLGKEDVYCCKVNSEEHLWVCNGVVTHNCTEIFLADNEDESFVCDLSSMNILHYDQWKNTNAVELLVYFLDAVMTEFIDKGKKIKFMDRPVRFAERHRALGVGWLGWHSYLQSKMIPWESMEAKHHNVAIAKNIKEAAYAASANLAEEYGEPEVLKGYGRRNTTLLAIAPTKSSAFILGQVSEGIEPQRSNYYIKDLQNGKFTVKNPYLQELLKLNGQDNDEVWESILRNSGSVQHLPFLSDHEKDVFKTFCEISPKEIIIQASQRQKYIDQGQSLNLMIHPSIPTKDVNALMIEAWELGIKSLYYQISVNAAQAFSRSILSCANCES